MTSVLVVEDEESFVEALTLGLTREGFDVSVARDGREALEVFDEADHEIVLLDVMLPKLSGLDVCRELRSRSDVPIILVTARSSELDIVVGLEVGADDYIAKPYRTRELVARMRAVMRRRGAPAPPANVGAGASIDLRALVAHEPAVIEVGDVKVDQQRHEVEIRGVSVSLPLKEFELLSLLLDNAGRVLTREVLMDRVWGTDYVGDTKTLDVHIKRLRAKIEPNPSQPDRIVTIRGLGYKYVSH